MNWNTFILQLFQSAAPYLKKRGDLMHTKVAHQYALVLMNKEGGSKKIVEPAVILHDVGWSSLSTLQIRAAFGVRACGKNADKLNRIHEIKGAVIARHILDNLEYDTQLTKKIVAIIEQHDSGTTASCTEEQIVKDADKLWRFSQKGFWKETQRQGIEPKELYQYLLARYSGWFYTSAALKIAEEEVKNRIHETKQKIKNAK